MYYTNLALQPSHLLLFSLITTLPFLSSEFLVDANHILDSLSSKSKIIIGKYCK